MRMRKGTMGVEVRKEAFGVKNHIDEPIDDRAIRESHHVTAERKVRVRVRVKTGVRIRVRIRVVMMKGKKRGTHSEIHGEGVSEGGEVDLELRHGVAVLAA